MLRIRTIPFGDWNFMRDWLKTRSSRVAAEITRRKAIHDVALWFLAEWRRQSAMGLSGTLPNAALTRLTKSGNVRGKDSGELNKKIKLHYNDVFTFVGIMNGETLKNGQDAVIVAKSNEFGTIHPRRPKNVKWLSLPLTHVAKSAGSPLKYPGDLKWHIEKEGDEISYYWKDAQSGALQYRNVSAVSRIPENPVMRTALRRTRQVFPHMVLQQYKTFFLMRKSKTGKPAVDPFDRETWTGWKYD